MMIVMKINLVIELNIYLIGIKNLAQQSLYITYNLNSDVVFEILNAEGLSCVKLNLEASKTTRVLNLEHLNSGYYIYKVILTNGFFEVGKFCIVR